MQNAILYQAYGGQEFLNECRYSLLKYLQVYNLTPPPQTAIIIYTDQPEAFSEFTPFFHRLLLQPVTPEMIQQWKGGLDFVHRFKIEMLIHFLKTFEGAVLYCDTDTYLTEPIEPLLNDLAEGRFCLHQYEGMIDEKENASFHKWQKFLSTTSLTYNNHAVAFSTSLRMYNAGVVGLNSRASYLLQDVLALTDEVYQKFPKHIAEQFAFSYCFQKAGQIRPANHHIAHYWNLKEFRSLLQTFFVRNTEESIPNLIKKLHTIDAMSIQQDKHAFKRLPFLRKLARNISGRGWKIAQYEKRI